MSGTDSSPSPTLTLAGTNFTISQEVISNLLPPDVQIDNYALFLTQLNEPSANAHQLFLEYAKKWYQQYENNSKILDLKNAIILMGVSAILGNYYALGKLPTYLESYEQQNPDDRFVSDWLKIIDQGRCYLKNIDIDLVNAQQKLRRYSRYSNFFKHYYAHKINQHLSEKLRLLYTIFTTPTAKDFETQFRKHASLEDWRFNIIERLHSFVRLRFLNKTAGWLKHRIGDLILGTGKSREVAKKNIKDKYVPQVEAAMETNGLFIQESHVINEDFLRIETLEITQQNPEKKPLPTLLVYPGRSVNFAWGIKYFTDLAINAQCNVVVINNRNISMRSTKLANSYHDLVIDGQAVVSSLIKKGLTTHDQLTIYGHCNGGPAATALAYQLHKNQTPVKLISDRSFKSHEELVNAYLESKYQKLVPKNPWLQFFSIPFLAPVKYYFWLCSKRLGFLLKFSGWNHNQYKEFQQLPPELKIAFMVKPTAKEKRAGILEDNNIPHGAGLYEGIYSQHQTLIKKLLELRFKIENLRYRLAKNDVSNAKITDCSNVIDTLNAEINFLLSHRVIINQETMKTLGSKVNPHVAYVSCLSSPLLDKKTASAIEQIKAFVHTDIQTMRKTQPAALSPQEVAQDLSGVFSLVDAITPQLYVLERQRIAMEPPNTLDLFAQLRRLCA